MAQNWITTSPSSGTSGTSQVAVSASTNDGDTREQNLTVTATKWGITKTAQVAVKQYSEHTVIVDITGATFGETGGTEQATVTANYPWTATTDSDWITITPSTGTSGDTQITIAASQNTGGERTGTVTISDGTGSTTITVTQESGVHVLSVIPSSASFPGTGGTYVLYVTSNRPWSATTLVPWLDATPSTGASGTSSIVVSATANYNSARNATVIVSDGIASQTIQVSQAVAPSTGITVSPSALTLYDTGGTTQITVSSNYPITASSSSQLVSVSPSTGGSGTTVITLTASTASTGTTGYITVTNGFDTVQVPFTYVESGYENMYLTTRSLANNNKIGFVIPQNFPTEYATSISYSTDNGQTWTTENVEGVYKYVSVSGLSSGDTVIWKGTANRWGAFYGRSQLIPASFASTDNFEVYGNIMSLLYGDNFIGQTSFNQEFDSHFERLFKDSKVLKAENLVLPATTLGGGCYIAMFENCYMLATAPELPATTMTSNCYAGMFMECRSLTTAPELPATTLAYECYSQMFSGCYSLTTAPELPATTLAVECYNNMFFACRSLTTAPELPATTLTDYCYDGMFEGCISLTAAPELPATTLAESCYALMFYNCSTLNYIKCMATSGINSSSSTYNWVNGVASSGTFVYASGATVSPDSSGSGSTWPRGVNGIPTTWLPEEYVPYDQQYFTTRSLENNNTISFTTSTSATATSISYSLDNGNTWKNTSYNGTIKRVSVSGLSSGDTVIWKGIAKTWRICKFSSTGNYEVYGNIMSLLYGDNFTGQTILSSMYTFSTLFSGCTKIITAENLVLPATTLAEGCYGYMFKGCTSLTTAPELPATTLVQGCYAYMFHSCTSLTTAPELPATSLGWGCYEYMFHSCTSLTTAPELPATTLAYWCYYRMFDSCTSLTTAPELPAITLVQNCYYQMFSGCTNLNYIKCLATSGINTDDSTSNWVDDVASSGTFIKASSASWPSGDSGIPSGWTVIDAT